MFVLGPSHHVYLDGCALSRCSAYETPIGQLPLDLESQSFLRIGTLSAVESGTDSRGAPLLHDILGLIRPYSDQ